MHIKFLDYLVDPETKERLTLEVVSRSEDIIQTGFLRSTNKAYPIVQGIPRFVEFQSDTYSKSFGYQWQKWPRIQFESENVGKSMEGHTRQMWERITGIHSSPDELNDRVIADIGCGSGRFIDIARAKGARVIGIDSSSAVEVAQENFKHDFDVCICQADVLALPLKPDSLDGAFSIGVLHHTPRPEAGVNEAYKVIRGSGWFALSVYGKGSYYDFTTVQMWRKFFKLLWPLLKHHPPLLYTYFTNCVFRPIALAFPLLGNAIRVFFPFVKLPDFNWSLLDTFDSVTPAYQSAHECYEVFSWFKKAGFVAIEPTNWGFTSFRALKEITWKGP